MKFSSLLLTAVVPMFALSARAQSSSVSASGASAGETSGKISEVLKNRKFEETKEITDAKLKADGGSLSKYSLSFNLSYYGPTLGDLGAKDQPNPDGSIGTYETALGGSLGARYRLSSDSSISAGTGLKAIHPFHGMDRFDTNNPYLSYNVFNRVGALQMRNSPGISVITIPNYTRVGEFASMSYDFSMVYNLGRSRFALGLDSSLGYFLYNREYRKKDGKSSRYNLAFYPALKYNFTDKLNLNTSLSLSFWNPRGRDDQWSMLNRSVNQRLALGYAVTRDIYVSPYLTFYPNNLTTDGTTLNFSTVFSLL